MKKRILVGSLAGVLLVGGLGWQWLNSDPPELLADSCSITQSKNIAYSEDELHHGQLTITLPDSQLNEQHSLKGYLATFNGFQTLFKVDALQKQLILPLTRQYTPGEEGTRAYWNTSLMDNLLWETGTSEIKRGYLLDNFGRGGSLVLTPIIGDAESGINHYAYSSDASLVKYTGSKLADQPGEYADLFQLVDVTELAACVPAQTRYVDVTENYYQLDREGAVSNKTASTEGITGKHTVIPVYKNNYLEELSSPPAVENSKRVGWNSAVEVVTGFKPEYAADEPSVGTPTEGKYSLNFSYYYQIDPDQLPKPTEENKLTP